MGKAGHEMTVAEREAAHNRNEAFADEVIRLYAQGESYRKIAAATGIPFGTVAHMCKRLSAAYVRERYGDVTAILGRELHILDSLTRNNLPAANRGDGNAAKIVMDAHIRRSRLLGLDKAIQAEITVRTAQDVEIERLMALMNASDGEGSPDHADGPESGTAAYTAPDGGDSA